MATNGQGHKIRIVGIDRGLTDEIHVVMASAFHWPKVKLTVA